MIIKTALHCTPVAGSLRNDLSSSPSIALFGFTLPLRAIIAICRNSFWLNRTASRELCTSAIFRIVLDMNFVFCYLQRIAI